MKMILLTNIVTTTGIEKQNAHKLTIKNSALIRDGGGRVMIMDPTSNIATTTMIEKHPMQIHSMSIIVSRL